MNKHFPTSPLVPKRRECGIKRVRPFHQVLVSAIIGTWNALSSWFSEERKFISRSWPPKLKSFFLNINSGFQMICSSREWRFRWLSTWYTKYEHWPNPSFSLCQALRQVWKLEEGVRSHTRLTLAPLKPTYEPHPTDKLRKFFSCDAPTWALAGPIEIWHCTSQSMAPSEKRLVCLELTYLFNSSTGT